MCEISTGPSLFPRIGGELLVVPVAECCGAWRRAWLSSLEAPLATRGSRRRPVTPVSGMVVVVEGTVLCA